MIDINRIVCCLATAGCMALPVARVNAQDDIRQGPSSYYTPSAPQVSDMEHVNFAYAQVLNVAPIYEDVRVPRPVESCGEYERVERVRPQSAGGTVLGAIIGGVVGNQVGSGSGRRVATVAGAVAGGAIGREAGTRTRVSSETRCQVGEEYVIEQQVVAYDVEYRYRGEVFMSRLDHNPGDRLRIRVAVSPVQSPPSYEQQSPGLQ
jgi:uncharacterized protein YcfJ